MEFKLPELPYDYDALKPYIDEQTMKIHHDKHHQGYTNNFNKAIEGLDVEGKTAKEIIANLNSIPEDKRIGVKNNGGGYINHSLFWKILKKDVEPSGAVLEAINSKFGSFEGFKDEFSKAAAAHCS